MKNIATMLGKNFAELYDESAGFSGIALSFRKSELKAVGYANNPYYGGRTVVDCLSIQEDRELVFNRPPVKPSANESVSIVEDEDGNIVISYALAGYAFTTRKGNEDLAQLERNAQRMHSEMDAKITAPHIEISANIKYLIATLRNIKKAHSNQVTISISSEVEPIVLKGETGSEKIVMPLRNRSYMDGCRNLAAMLRREEEMDVAASASELKCPRCNGSLKLYKSRMVSEVPAYCYHCGQKINLSKD